MITQDQAYIAIRHSDGFVDGACFAESEDAKIWCQEMRAAGFHVQVCDRKEAKAILFTYVLPPRTIIAYGHKIGVYYDRPIPSWVMTADGVRWDFDSACGPQPDFDALPQGCCVIAPGLVYLPAQ